LSSVTHSYTTSKAPTSTAHGIAFYGSAATPMTNIVVEGNEIAELPAGQSESLVLNGNVDGFIVAGNMVPTTTTSGSTSSVSRVRARSARTRPANGICVDNVV